jgi:hypothetical protein
MDSFRRRCSAFEYSLPTVVVSYPRSGSNFLQNVLAASSGLPLRSFHSPVENMRELCHYGLKSHAISSDWLADEFSRTTLNYKYPEKIIYVYRDPRDVMISFYEFVQHMKGVTLDQASFLTKVSYIYATYTDKDPVLGRTNSMQPMSVLDGYRAHYQNWMVRAGSKSYHIVKYEDLVTMPEVTFQGIFDFLELKCDLSAEALGQKVSQYDSRSRKRGGVSGWKKNLKKYDGIISSVEEQLSEEIEYLSY